MATSSTSLKRPFHDVEQYEHHPTDYRLPAPHPNACLHSQNQSDAELLPELPPRDWNQVWHELLGESKLDPGDAGDATPDPENFLSSINDVQHDMESWLGNEFRTSSFVISEELHVETMELDGFAENDWNVCYGMSVDWDRRTDSYLKLKIYRAKTKLDGNMIEVCRSLQDNPAQTRTHFILEIICLNDDLWVCIPGNIRMARLNMHLTEALVEHVQSHAIQLEALVHRRTIFDAERSPGPYIISHTSQRRKITNPNRDIGAATKLKEAHTTVNINVYGSEASQASIGRDLSAKKVWLQRPDWHRPTSTYDNPHFLKLGTEEQPNGYNIPTDVEQTTKQRGFQDSLQEMYSMLTRDSQLKGLAGDGRLRTVLLPHQEKALDFMIQRETGPIPEEFQQWEATNTESEVWYRHRITGVKSRLQPPEVGGGILADEMGMGKTFSILALFVRTLEEAIQWSNDAEVHIAEGIPPTKIISRATLVVVPSPLLLTTWHNEIRDRLNVPLKILIHHGNDRPREPKVMANYDLVLTTYHTIISDYSKYSPATEIAWYRIVLDEAHFIRRMSTFLHKRVAELDAKFRWCLSGTPIQNTFDDIGSLFAFVKISPFDRLGVFRKFITTPFSEGGMRRADAQSNLAKLFDSMCIRRTKDQMNLAVPEEKVHYVHFSDAERTQYRKTREDMKRALDHLAGESESRNKFSLFQAQLQLRLLCNHGTYQHQFHWARSRNTRDAREDALTSAGNDSEVECSTCKQVVHGVFTNRAFALTETCAHVLCPECREGTGENCPVCEALNVRLPRHATGRGGRAYAEEEEEASYYFRPDGHSSKMLALVDDLSATTPGDKSLVFSCWTTTLDLIARHLRAAGIAFDRIDGEHSVDHRQRVLDRFETDPALPVLIMTTGVGAFGLNIIAANRVFLVEPQWNPSLEDQAVGRTNRIGQQKAVQVTRYVVLDTVEGGIRELQRRKRGIAKMTGRDLDAGAQAPIKSEYGFSFN